MPPCSPNRENSAAPRSARTSCPQVRARRSSCSSSERNALGTEAYAQLLALGANIDHLRQVQANRPLVAFQIMPAVAAESLVERLQLLVAHAQRQHLTALEAD